MTILTFIEKSRNASKIQREEIEKVCGQRRKVVVDSDGIEDTRRRYIQQLFCDNRPVNSQKYCETGSSIQTEHVQSAKEGIASSPDIQNFLRLLNEDRVK